MKVSVVGDYDTVTGFRLAGVKEAFPVDGPEQALEEIKGLVRREDIAIIITTERIMEKVRDDVSAMLEGKSFPLVVEVPDKEGKIEKKVDPIKELIRRAVGVEIKV